MRAKNMGTWSTPEPEAAEEYKPGSLAIFEFTPENLRANRGGYLTDKRQGWLQSTAGCITGCSMAPAPIEPECVLPGLTITLGLYLTYLCQSGPHQPTMSYEHFAA